MEPRNSSDVFADQFTYHLTVERGLAKNTIESYSRDLGRYIGFLDRRNLTPPSASQVDLMEYVSSQAGRLSIRSIARNVSALKMFYRFLLSEGKIESNPARLLSAPKLPRRLPGVLSTEEVEKLLSQPDPNSGRGKRDKAMLEILYATGLRVSELVKLTLSNVNMEAGYLRTIGKGSKERIVPVGAKALAALRELIFEAVPNAEETTQYRMPTYEHRGQMLCAYASQKHYMSLYMDTSIVAEHRVALAGLSVGKSCIRFKRLEDLPLDTIRVMLEETVARQAGL
jgi:integrase/recombinase XerD